MSIALNPIILKNPHGSLIMVLNIKSALCRVIAKLQKQLSNPAKPVSAVFGRIAHLSWNFEAIRIVSIYGVSTILSHLILLEMDAIVITSTF